MLAGTACTHGRAGSTPAGTPEPARAATARPAARNVRTTAPPAPRPPHRAAAGAGSAAPAPAPQPRQPPQILSASVNPAVVGSGTVVHAVVWTTAGVVTVVAYAGGASLPVPRVGPGLFAGSTTLPPLPPFARGDYAVTFVARDAHGASTQSAVGVRVR